MRPHGSTASTGSKSTTNTAWIAYPHRCDVCDLKWCETVPVPRDIVVLDPTDPLADNTAPKFLGGAMPRPGVLITWPADGHRCPACERMMGGQDEDRERHDVDVWELRWGRVRIIFTTRPGQRAILLKGISRQRLNRVRALWSAEEDEIPESGASGSLRRDDVGSGDGTREEPPRLASTRRSPGSTRPSQRRSADMK
jgi:hypothetical protein